MQTSNIQQTLTVSMAFVNEMTKPCGHFIVEIRKACRMKRQAFSYAKTGVSNELGCGNRHLHHIGRLWSFGTLDDIEFDVFSLLQGLEAIPLKRRVMHEYIFSAIQADKPEALPIVKPLHGTFCLHKTPPFLNGHATLRDRARTQLMHVE